MRTTLSIPNDVLAAAKSLGSLRNLSVGDALAELARRGLQQSPGLDLSHEFPCFAVGPGAQPITLERTLELEDEW